ncbi:uncharacterized protein LOC114558611 [Perca flavescens]|uniref:uncharacterized protein LOC114558611 n=1 Tax=Perca flavescens TaxID=8167 RepID=UPI00106EA3F8|nr:uncharacterized protein LOC114558611 [Perca flavescens]
MAAIGYRCSRMAMIGYRCSRMAAIGCRCSRMAAIGYRCSRMAMIGCRCSRMAMIGCRREEVRPLSGLSAVSSAAGLQYYFVYDRKNFTEAQRYCREKHTDLVTVDSMEVMNNLTNMADLDNMFYSNNSYRTRRCRLLEEDPFWIGLFSDSWKWSDGSTSSFSFWKNGQPDNNKGNKTCVAADFSQSGAWEGWPCDMERAFICYGPVVPVSKKVMKVKFENKKNLDLNDPAVMEAMLKQLKQKLRAQGLDDNIKLSWRKQADGKVFHKEDKKTNKRRRKREEL